MFLIICLIFAVLGFILVWAQSHFKIDSNPLIDKIDALLPQTQCGQCGYPGCRPYAQAIFKKETGINLCPPGGEETLKALGDLLGFEYQALQVEAKEERFAFIDESLCIGCSLCIQACPVDAILGAPKYMHTVIESICTGCELCIAPCPVDCIHMRLRS